MMEARLIVATVAQRWRFLREPDQEIIPVQLVTLPPKNRIRMKLTTPLVAGQPRRSSRLLAVAGGMNLTLTCALA